jgi:hypothetical protein
MELTARIRSCEKTLILKIANPDQDLVDTMQRYAEGMNYASKFVYEKGKPIPAMKLQAMTFKPW